MDFKYSIDDKKDLIDIEEFFQCAQEPNNDEIIAIRKDEDSGIALIANKEGWLYLAKLCVEMAYASDKDPRFHLHRRAEFQFSKENFKDEISFFLSDNSFDEEVRKKRNL